MSMSETDYRATAYASLLAKRRSYRTGHVAPQLQSAIDESEQSVGSHQLL